jgi:serine/threonine-protein kinase
MALATGSTLGVYEIVSLLGSGGMGEVYRARDTKLGREVAIKVLPEAFAFDPDRVARFEREAKVLASLNHPHIAALHGMEVSEGRHFLIMELVEGETLADRLRRGALPVEDTLKIAIQIADALEAAHEKGVVHRDLKPANVKITPDDRVKVLDFGLAKAMEPAGAGLQAGPNALTNSPTLSMMATQAGMILGTAAYMSPEQAKGLPADHRSDVFSFGCVLYEMLTGRQPFQGDTTPDILASVLAREPDLAALPANLNPRLSQLLRRCLDKHPKRRWQAVGDLRVELEAVAGNPRALPTPSVGAAGRPLWRRAVPIVVTALLASALSVLALLYVRPVSRPITVARFSLILPEGQGFDIARQTLAVSPDGTRMVYDTSEGLYVRSTSELEGRIIFSQDSSEPTFSPDGEWIAFVGGGALRRISFAGGPVLTLCPVTDSHGITWGAEGILFGQGREGIFRVSSNGGAPERLVTMKEGEWAFGPQILPGGEWVLFTLSMGNTAEQWDAAQIVTQSLMSGKRKVLVEDARDARYLASGHLVFAQGGVISAAPFDAQRRELTGAPVPVLDGVRRSTLTGASHFSVSKTGLLIYVPGPTGTTSGQVDIVVADRAGAARRLMIPAGPYEFPRLSPDGGQLAFGTVGTDQNIWIYDLAGTTAPRRLTFGGRNRFPIWAADRRRIAFQSDRDGDLAIFWQSADGSGTAERLTKPDSGIAHVPEAWSPRGDRFLFSTVGSNRTLWSFSLKDKKAEPFGGITRPNNPIAAAFSPDGQWVTYAGQGGIYVQPVPPTGATYQIAGGFHPWWSRDGKEILFIPGGFGRVASVNVTTQPTFTFGTPMVLTRGFNEKLGPSLGKNFDVTADGRFIGLAAPGQSQGVALNQINVVLNWFEELKARVPNP